ncbi:Transcriptional regulator [Plesiocystis pacifica SIR-1]|uniref:Transcriptional regulator n=1 Tax=Plesiocystis pacifica SIR-1 TaxID=391625 RepID=A6GEE3_9BACT|nr:LysR family transcriptional regulator [Plesiocystis pacifica]EDM75784.1 Transcriptional regulator [Plesiocystis pacifica SIR-1]
MDPQLAILNDVVVFTEVVRQSSFTRAGKVVGLPASAVSRRVARLEAALGFKLLHRTTRSVGLTDAGRVYYERTAHIAHDVLDAARAVQEYLDTPKGLLRVTAPPDDGGVIWAMISGFVRDHPEVELEIIHTLEYVDLIEAGVDVALRGGSPPDSTALTARRLVDSRFVLVASPRYLERRGTPTRPEELAEHDCVAMDTWVPNAFSSLMGPDGPVSVDFRNRVRSNSQETARKAALDGFGIAPMVEMTCWRQLESGALVEVLPGALPWPATFWAVYPVARSKSAATRAFVEHLVRNVPALTGPVPEGEPA